MTAMTPDRIAKRDQVHAALGDIAQYVFDQVAADTSLTGYSVAVDLGDVEMTIEYHRERGFLLALHDYATGEVSRYPADADWFGVDTQTRAPRPDFIERVRGTLKLWTCDEEDGVR